MEVAEAAEEAHKKKKKKKHDKANKKGKKAKKHRKEAETVLINCNAVENGIVNGFSDKEPTTVETANKVGHKYAQNIIFNIYQKFFFQVKGHLI